MIVVVAVVVAVVVVVVLAVAVAVAVAAVVATINRSSGSSSSSSSTCLRFLSSALALAHLIMLPFLFGDRVLSLCHTRPLLLLNYLCVVLCYFVFMLC